MRKITVLGIEIIDYSVREALRKADMFLRTGQACTIAYVAAKGLIAAEESEQVRDMFASMDMIVAADAQILFAAEGSRESTPHNRIREVENHEFIQEFLKRLARGGKTLYLLAETAKRLERLEEALRSYQEDLQIAGTFSFEEMQTENDDFVVNAVNVAGPHVLISELDIPGREEFIQANRAKLNVNLWLLLQDEMCFNNKKTTIFLKAAQTFWRFDFRRKISKHITGGKEEE